MGQPLFIDATDSEIRSRVYDLIRKGLILNVCNEKKRPVRPVCIALSQRGYAIPFTLHHPEDDRCLAEIRYDRPGWPVVRNYSINARIYRYY